MIRFLFLIIGYLLVELILCPKVTLILKCECIIKRIKDFKKDKLYFNEILAFFSEILLQSQSIDYDYKLRITSQAFFR